MLPLPPRQEKAVAFCRWTSYDCREVNAMLFDNHDERIPYYELILERKNLDDICAPQLPTGFRFVFYKPGDRDAWINIEISAKELKNHQQGVEVWEKYYGGKDDELIHRMVFVENELEEKVATATAFYDVTGRDNSGAGWLHWVAVRRDYQGMKLSKPLIGYVLNLMKSLGYEHGKIPTQTTTWLACKIYLDFGFRPVPKNAENSRAGWNIVKTLTNHPALDAFEIIDVLAQKGQG